MLQFSRVEDAIEAIANGRLVIVADAEDRENEGDFVGAAETVTAETVHFMISEGRGQLCLPILPEIARQLDLTPMVPETNAAMPHFTIPVDHGLCRTGISPQERAFTIRKIIDPASRPADFVRPGHVFPLIAREGGVLERPGHTEATIDLIRLASLRGAGVLCEICSGDGKSMATGPELLEIADRFGMPIITIDDVIRFRQKCGGGWPQKLAGSKATRAL
ncbi:MAG: 3,4-dihydroxy-2-butanone-4-phosphate synthase [Planctomycetaceae bacterium]